MGFPVVVPLRMNLSALVSYSKGSDVFRDLFCDPLGLRLGWLAYSIVSWPPHLGTSLITHKSQHVNTTLNRQMGVCVWILAAETKPSSGSTVLTRQDSRGDINKGVNKALERAASVCPPARPRSMWWRGRKSPW